MTSDYIEWATTWAPAPSTERSPFHVAVALYDEVDARLGDVAEHDEFFTRVLWLETAIRLAQVGWTIVEVEAHRWPLQGKSHIVDLVQDL
jgi:hypothetical protein